MASIAPKLRFLCIFTALLGQSPCVSGWAPILRTDRRSCSWKMDALKEVEIHVDNKRSTRRRKKNKYGEFSKINSESDPLDELIAVSERKLQQLEEEYVSEARKKRPSPDLGALPRKEFPDTSAIDPYDPTTFGYIEIAHVVAAHGVHGWLKVRSTTDFAAERLCTASVRHLKAANKRAPRQVTLLHGKHCRENEYLIQLEDIETREDADRHRGATLYARVEEEKPKPSEHEYLVADLVGLEVFMHEPELRNSKDRAFVGTVGGVAFAKDVGSLPGLGHDLLELVLPRGKGGLSSLRDELVLIPFVPQLVPIVDMENRAIYIDPPKGLLDLKYVREEKMRTKGLLDSVDPVSDEG